jgi:YggT family protein
MEVLITAINLFALVFNLLIFARIILSFIPSAMGNPFGRTIFELTEPLLAPIRKVVPPIGGMFDLSPIILLIALELLQFVANTYLTRL